MNKFSLKKLIEQLTDEVIAEKQLDEAPKPPQKINPKYTHFFLLKSDNKIVNGFEYSKDTDKESIAQYAKGDLADMDLKLSDVLVLTVKGCKQKGIDPFNPDSWKKNIDEKTIVASSDGTDKTLTADQKKKVQMAADSGDSVMIKKKGAPISESEETPSPVPEINIAEAIDTAISQLTSLSETNENAIYKRLAEKTVRALNTAKDCYSKLSEKMSLDEEKDADKHVDHVKKHLSKKLKDKADLEPLMKKYAPVIKVIKKKVADPAKAAEHVWAHILKENKDI